MLWLFLSEGAPNVLGIEAVRIYDWDVDWYGQFIDYVSDDLYS